MAGKIDDLSEKVGRLTGIIESHIGAAEREWAERDDERRENADYRKDVRGTLSTLTAGVAKIPALEKRIDEIDGDKKTSLKMRLLTLEGKAALAAAAVGGLGAFILAGFYQFAGELKSLAFYLLKSKGGP